MLTHRMIQRMEALFTLGTSLRWSLSADGVVGYNRINGMYKVVTNRKPPLEANIFTKEKKQPTRYLS